ncbi:uncharacterized protein LOC144580147 isoform X1 [Callithrix jacchus]
MLKAPHTHQTAPSPAVLRITEEALENRRDSRPVSRSGHAEHPRVGRFWSEDSRMAFAHPGPGLLQKSPETPPSETCPSRLVAQGKLNAWRAPRMALPIFCAAFWDPAPRSPAPPGISPRLPAWSRRGTEWGKMERHQE